MRGGDQKQGPCEGMARGASPTAFVGGETATISWTETVEHGGGFFRISIDTDGDDFDGDGDGTGDYPASASMMGGNGDGSLMIVDIPDRDINADGMPNYTAEITIPNVDCDNCTLQLIQMMGDREPADMNQTAHIYFRCADITISMNPDGADAGVGGAGGEGGEGGMAGEGGAEPEPPMMDTEPDPDPTPNQPPPAVIDPNAAPPEAQGGPAAAGGAAAMPGAGGTAAGDPSGATASASDDGGGCNVSAASRSCNGFGAFALLGLALALIRRRR